MKKILILFGGQSAEHEVSIITGLQVAEKIDRELFEPHCVYLTQEGIFLYYQGLKSRRDFKKINPKHVYLSKDKKGGFLLALSLLSNKIYVDAAYLAFHGGSGESGQMQGLLETLEIPYTSSSVESSSITMNKALTKQVLAENSIDVIPGLAVVSEKISSNLNKTVDDLISKLKLPLIVKPAHLGSSIGVKVAKNKIELKKALLESSHMDTEVVIEKFMTDFKEYNCSVRFINGKLEVSEVEEPVSQDLILSFADKYQRGGNKKGGGGEGMASLVRRLPAPIASSLKNKIQNRAKEVFLACRCKGMVRIDFMYTKNSLFTIEVNPIPGSMAFYLWEATGIPFKQQITDLLNQAILDEKQRQGRALKHSSDIVEKFIS